MRASFIILLVLTLAAFVLFAARPQIDLAAAHWFYSDGFAGQGAWGRAVRGFLYGLPVVVCALFLLSRWLPLPLPCRPSSRGMLFVIASLALGPGILVNVILKDHSHRPRPNQIVEFGGPSAYRPVGAFDGACVKNCSFVSGEASAAFWMVAPASLAPPPLQVPAIALALTAGVVTGLLRMAYGAHFLSDVVLAGLLTLLLVVILRWFFFPGLRGRRPTL